MSTSSVQRLVRTDRIGDWPAPLEDDERSAPVRYVVDPSIGTTALRIGTRELLADLNGAGFHFEALVVRDLRIYAQPLGGEIYSWREANGRKEVDAIIETPEGWSAFEIKLTGDPSVIDDAAKQLLHFAASVDQKKHGTPAALSVITATGGGGLRPTACTWCRLRRWGGRGIKRAGARIRAGDCFIASGAWVEKQGFRGDGNWLGN